MSSSGRDAARNLAQARRLLRGMVRDGRLEQSEADGQLGMIERAARAGVPILVVADICSPKPHRAATDAQRRRTAHR